MKLSTDCANFRSAVASADGSNAGRGGGEGGEQRYDLVLALIEKYLKEKSSKKLQKENTQVYMQDSVLFQ